MANSTFVKLACVSLLCMVMAAPLAEAITCGTVTSTLAPCVSYLTGAAALSQSCCSGVSSLNSMAATTPDRQTTCNCLKSVASEITGLNYNNAAALPSQCGVNIPYKISPSTDCSKVQ